jgi:hypothetical protein
VRSPHPTVYPPPLRRSIRPDPRGFTTWSTRHVQIRQRRFRDGRQIGKNASVLCAVDHHLPAERIAEMLCREAREQIGAGAGRRDDDEPAWPDTQGSKAHLRERGLLRL